MKTKIITTILSLLSICCLQLTDVSAQKGVPYLTNFELPATLSNQNWSMIQGDNHLMYILNRKGVYQFDGYEWVKLEVMGKPLAIFYSEYLFVSSNEEMGYMKKDEKGQYVYNTVQDETSDIFFKFAKLDDQVYASGTQHICRITTKEPFKTEPIYQETDSTQFITDFFELNGTLYFIKNNKVVYRLNDTKAERTSATIPDKEYILFAFIHDQNIFLGTSGNVLLRFNGYETRTTFMKDQKYFDASIINSGISIDNNRFALGTLIGGCVVINSKNLETETILNYSNGLPDDEIISLGTDSFGGLWIAHGMGMSRADLNIPVKSFNNYEGISGNVLSIAEYNKTLFAGCSDGLYYLAEKKDFREVMVPVKQVQTVEKPVEVKKEPEQVVSSEQQQVQTTTIEDSKKKKGFFNRLFSKSAREEVRIEKEAEGIKEAEVKKDEKKEISAAKKKIYSLQSVNHVYQKVPNIDGKCKQLLIYDNKLLAATSTGIYEVDFNTGKPLVKGMYILYAKPSDYYNKTLYLCTTDGIQKLHYINNKWQTLKIFSIENEYPVSLVELSEDVLIISTEFNVYKLTIVQGGQAQVKQLTPEGKSLDSPTVRNIDGKIKVYTNTNAYQYNPESDSLAEDPATVISNLLLVYTQNNLTWVREDLRWRLHSKEKEINIPASRYLGLFEKVNDIFLNEKNELLLINDYNNIIRVKVDPKDTAQTKFSLFVKQVVDKAGSYLTLDEIKVNYSNNALKVNIGAPFYIKEKSLEYQYFIEGIDKEWSNWTKTNPLEFNYIPNGKYTLKIKARDIFGNESSEYSVNFNIKPPFWKTFWFISICAIGIIFLFIQFVRFRERQLLKEKQILEEKVRERTKTIEEQKEVLAQKNVTLTQQKEEITQQKEEIEAQRDEIEAQRDHIQKQNEEITKSIEYAKRIQTAVMPSKEMVESMLPEHFILFRPRDIVSGDFYWMDKKDGKIILVAADCTGHGVPGAFMSMLGVSFLNEIVAGTKGTQANLILNKLRDLIKSTLSQTGKEGESKDGMDIALCVIDFESKKIEFAGAYNPLYLVRNGELIETKADKMPVGIHLIEKDSFTNNVIDFTKGDTIYIFSDGYVSQFGGDDGRKYMAKPFKQLLTKIADKPMSKQQQLLEEEIETWMGYHPQVDDVLVIGVRF